MYKTIKQGQKIVWVGNNNYFWNSELLQWEYDDGSINHGLTKFFTESMIINMDEHFTRDDMIDLFGLDAILKLEKNKI